MQIGSNDDCTVPGSPHHQSMLQLVDVGRLHAYYDRPGTFATPGSMEVQKRHVHEIGSRSLRHDGLLR